jgi:putative nucleotidyltransferase with HDIG domain
MDREQAWQTVVEHVQDRGLRRHMLAVEAAMRDYAGRLGADPETWGLAGLLHDFDWEVHPALERHPKEGAPILRSRGCPEEVVQAILAHNEAGTGVARSQPMDFALLACDELTGLIIAATLVRPAKDVREMAVKSVKRNWKDKRFAAAVDRDELAQVAADFSAACFDGRLELWEHVGNVLASMQRVAGELDLDGRLVGSGVGL